MKKRFLIGLANGVILLALIFIFATIFYEGCNGQINYRQTYTNFWHTVQVGSYCAGCIDGYTPADTNTSLQIGDSTRPLRLSTSAGLTDVLSAEPGMLTLNNADSNFYGYNGAAWLKLSGGGGGGTITGADNGLHVVGTEAFLGGNIVTPTTINITPPNHLFFVGGFNGTESLRFDPSFDVIDLEATENGDEQLISIYPDNTELLAAANPGVASNIMSLTPSGFSLSAVNSIPNTQLQLYEDTNSLYIQDENSQIDIQVLATGDVNFPLIGSAPAGEFLTTGTNGKMELATAGTLTAANNGLTVSGTTVQLGGALTKNTLITGTSGTFQIDMPGNTGQPASQSSFFNFVASLALWNNGINTKGGVEALSVNPDFANIYSSGYWGQFFNTVQDTAGQYWFYSNYLGVPGPRVLQLDSVAAYLPYLGSAPAGEFLTTGTNGEMELATPSATPNLNNVVTYNFTNINAFATGLNATIFTTNSPGEHFFVQGIFIYATSKTGTITTNPVISIGFTPSGYTDWVNNYQVLSNQLYFEERPTITTPIAAGNGTAIVLQVVTGATGTGSPTLQYSCIIWGSYGK